MQYIFVVAMCSKQPGFSHFVVVGTRLSLFLVFNWHGGWLVCVVGFRSWFSSIHLI
jgi:hypothetical protein